MRARAGALTILAAALALAGCTSVVRYGDGLVDAGTGRSLFTRLPATVGGTAGFVVGLPVDVLVFAPAWVYYQSLPRETRDPVSVFLFSSFVLWKVGVLVGAPFDAVESALWRPRRAATDVSGAQREAIEREWDARGAFPVYPVTPIVPPPDEPDGAPRP